MKAQSFHNTIEPREYRGESLEYRGWPGDREDLAPGLAVWVGPGTVQAEVSPGELGQAPDLLGGVGEGEQGDDGLPGVAGTRQVKWYTRGWINYVLFANFKEDVDQIIV